MKKLTSIAIACIITLSAFAQSTPTATTPSSTTKANPAQTTPAKTTSAQQAPAKVEVPPPGSSKDCLMMKDNKMWIMKAGTTTAMSSQMTLKNGTKVMTDGTYTTKDGKKMTMKNGECMGLDGTIMKKDEAKKEEAKKQEPTKK